MRWRTFMAAAWAARGTGPSFDVRAVAAGRRSRRATGSLPIRLAAEVGVDFRRPAWIGHSRQEVTIETWGSDQSFKADVDDAALVPAVNGYRAPGKSERGSTEPGKPATVVSA